MFRHHPHAKPKASSALQAGTDKPRLQHPLESHVLVEELIFFNPTQAINTKSSSTCRRKQPALQIKGDGKEEPRKVKAEATGSKETEY